MKDIKFERNLPDGFYRVLRKRVTDEFKGKNVSQSGGYRMWIKAIVLVLVYTLPFVIMLFPMGALPYIALWLIAGFGMSGIGMGVMHDANHGSFSKNPLINKMLGTSIVFICGHVITWKIQHNVLHHTYTNIKDMDEDIDSGGLVRLHPEQKYSKMHRFQHIYAPILYSLTTLNWYLTKDFKQLIRYQKAGLIEQIGGDVRKEWVKAVLGKLLYTLLLIVLPLLLHPQAWYVVILGFVTMHLLSGSFLSWIFQLAHAIPETDMENKMSKLKGWAEHQLHTTANFSRNNRFFTWFFGGLNYQIEHHLFPNISHVHYPRIAKIVEETAREFSLPYHQTSIWKAIHSHYTHLRLLSKKTA